MCEEERRALHSARRSLFPFAKKLEERGVDFGERLNELLQSNVNRGYEY